MTIKKLVAMFQKEKQEEVPSRFPCRAVMVRNVEEYCALLYELKKINDIRVVQTSELFSNIDVMPRYSNLMVSKYQDEWLILTGVSEYLRLFSKKEEEDGRFASLWGYQAPASSKGRIIIPLWGCEAQWFDSKLKLNRDLRQQEFFFDCSSHEAVDQKMNLLILSGAFEQYVAKLDAIQGDLKIGLQDWFDYWTAPSPESTNFVLLTKRCNTIKPIDDGTISIRVITDTFSFVREHMEGAEILANFGYTEDMLDELLDYALKGKNLDQALLSILNVATFSGVDIMGKWKTMSMNHKRFVSLWFSLHQDGSYTCHCFNQAKGVSDIENCIMHEIFKVGLDKPEWINEFRQLMVMMALTPDDQFFEELDSIPVYETRLDFLSGSSRGERIYLLRMVGKWMRTDYCQVANCDKLEGIYPELFHYLSNNGHANDEAISNYMSRYKAYKLENTLPVDEDVFFPGIQVDSYDNRYSVLSDSIDDQTIILWVDALGVEWLPLLQWTVTQNCDGKLARLEVVQANLPTETCFNDIWKDMSTPHIKLDKLDKLAHKGVIDEPDYYACIEEQLTFISGIYKHVSTLLKTYQRVIITGDHGTSRLAARFFHTRDGWAVPQDAGVCSHGRYCKLGKESIVVTPNVRIVKHADGTRFAVHANYDHFKQSGFAAGADDEVAIYGEVHGGASPEEVLVPVVVFDSNVEIPLTAEWETSTVKIQMKKARLTLKFNKPVKNVQVNIAGIDAEVTPVGNSTRWNVVAANIKPDRYTAQVHADKKIVIVPDVTIRSAIGGDGDLP